MSDVYATPVRHPVTVGRLNFGARWKQFVQSMLDQVIAQFPVEQFWSRRPLLTVTNQVLALREICDTMKALRVSRAQIEAQVTSERQAMMDRFPREFRRVVNTALGALGTCCLCLILLFPPWSKPPESPPLFNLLSPSSASLSSGLNTMLQQWRSGKLHPTDMFSSILHLLGLLRPRYGWFLFLAGAAIIGLLGWLAWRSIRVAIHAHRQWRYKLGEAVLLLVRSALNAAADERGITNLFVERAPGLHGHGDPAHLIPPPEIKRVRMLTQDLGAGVVAVSGDRGVGKTTLLRSLADPRYREPGSTELRLMLAAPVDYDAQEFLVHLYLSLCKVVRRIERPRGLFLLVRESRWRRLRVILAVLAAGIVASCVEALLVPFAAKQLIALTPFLLSLFVVISGVVLLLPPLNSPIDQLAHHRLHQLLFQQTVGLERSGALRPGWFQLSQRTSQQLADRPLTLPELVDSYREFVDRVVAWWRARNKGQGSIVIGIDEVDRITDAAQAERFLNELKAIFGARHCTYLVSVSEEALANFERRVVHVRTVLDSAFDEVLRIDVLDLDRALELLRRRMTGVPAPFLALCHCLSGGVARDLIRAARVMVDARRNTGLSLLGELTAEVVHREIQTLKQGFVTRIAHLVVECPVDELLDQLGEPNWPGRNAGQILATVRANLAGTEQRAADMAQARAELASALSFYVTIMELFIDRSDVVVAAVTRDPKIATSHEEHIEWSRAYNTVDALARARSDLSVSPGLVCRRLDRVRARLGLPLLGELVDL